MCEKPKWDIRVEQKSLGRPEWLPNKRSVGVWVCGNIVTLSLFPRGLAGNYYMHDRDGVLAGYQSFESLWGFSLFGIGWNDTYSGGVAFLSFEFGSLVESLLHGRNMANLRVPTEVGATKPGVLQALRYSRHWSHWVMISDGDPLNDLHFQTGARRPRTGRMSVHSISH